MIDSAQIVHLHLMADMEEVKKKMDQDVNAIAKLQKDLKQALQERISLQEKLSEVSVFLFFLFFFFFLFSFFFFGSTWLFLFLFFFYIKGESGWRRRKRGWIWLALSNKYQPQAFDEVKLARRHQRKEGHARHEKPSAGKHTFSSFVLWQRIFFHFVVVFLSLGC